MGDTPPADDDLAAQDREFRAAMAERDVSAAGTTSRLDRAAAEEAERDRAEFLAHLATHPPLRNATATSGERRAPRRTASLRELRRLVARPHWVPDAQLDLHGRTRAGARAALERFLAWSLDEGLTSALVVVGQGHHSPVGEAAVARVVRQWLEERGLKSLPAPPRLGGSGALLVSLSQAKRL